MWLFRYKNTNNVLCLCMCCQNTPLSPPQLWVIVVGSVEASMPPSAAYHQGYPEVMQWKAIWEPEAKGQLRALQPFWKGVAHSGLLSFVQVRGGKMGGHKRHICTSLMEKTKGETKDMFIPF